MYKSYLLILFFIPIMACQASKSSDIDSDAPTARVDDDIAVYRPRYTNQASQAPEQQASVPVAEHSNHVDLEATNHINTKLQAALDSMAQYNKHILYAQGFRVLVYTGNDRDQANKVKEKLYKSYPDHEVYLAYKQPTFRIKAGDFISRLAAQQFAHRLSADFPNVLVLPEQINIRK